MRITRHGEFVIDDDGLLITGWSLTHDGRSLTDAIKWLLFNENDNSADFREVCNLFSQGKYRVSDFSMSTV